MRCGDNFASDGRNGGVGGLATFEVWDVSHRHLLLLDFDLKCYAVICNHVVGVVAGDVPCESRSGSRVHKDSADIALQ